MLQSKQGAWAVRAGASARRRRRRGSRDPSVTIVRGAGGTGKTVGAHGAYLTWGAHGVETGGKGGREGEGGEAMEGIPRYEHWVCIHTICARYLWLEQDS